MPVPKRSEILKYTVTISGQPYQDAKGNWVVPDPETVTIELPCRSEANTSGRPVALADGTVLHYTFLVYLDEGMPEIPAQTPIEIIRDGKVVESGTVKRFKPLSKYCGVWV